MIANLSGPKMRQYLSSLGVNVTEVVRKRDTGHYVADVYVPGMGEAVQPAEVYAEQISSVIPATIVHQHNQTAHWRDGNPVVWASVHFKPVVRIPVTVHKNTVFAVGDVVKVGYRLLKIDAVDSRGSGVYYRVRSDYGVTWHKETDLLAHNPRPADSGISIPVIVRTAPPAPNRALGFPVCTAIVLVQ